MISTKRHVQQLAALLAARNFTHVVLCPGSRNGPLIHTLAGCGQFECRVIVDERSAGYFALGMARALKTPVVLVCSSGTAAVNFAPALAEAYYQKIPLIVVTADRPAYWIDQLENQCIRQEGLYKNFIKHAVVLPLEETETQLWYGARMINETLETVMAAPLGPVHINVPLEEPLHATLEMPLPEVAVVRTTATRTDLDAESLDQVGQQIKKAEKILVLAGQSPADPDLARTLDTFARKTNALVAAEHLANLDLPPDIFCATPELVLASITDTDAALFQPDLLITFGGHFVSKRIRQFLRANRPGAHIHVDAAGGHMDTYQSLTRVCAMAPEHFFARMTDRLSEFPTPQTSYVRIWKDRETAVSGIYDNWLDRSPFCDLNACSKAVAAVPHDSVLHLGNSATVRYALLTPGRRTVTYLGNRGTSGIDGSVSTAVGFAACSSLINTLILGDLSFFYDSNGLWNRYLGKNVRIILLNNGGGNIFSFVEDLSVRTSQEVEAVFDTCFFAGHSARAQGLASTFGLDYITASSASELDRAIETLFDPDRSVPTLLEVFTDARTNTDAFKGLFAQIRNK